MPPASLVPLKPFMVVAGATGFVGKLDGEARTKARSPRREMPLYSCPAKTRSRRKVGRLILRRGGFGFGGLDSPRVMAGGRCEDMQLG